MTRYLLDTTVLIDISRGREPAVSRIRAMIASGDELAISAINVAEFYAGLPPEKRVLHERFISALRYWHITRPIAMAGGQYRYDFARAGRTLSTTDALIAAVARQHGAVLLTDNLKDFPMTDIVVQPMSV